MIFIAPQNIDQLYCALWSTNGSRGAGTVFWSSAVLVPSGLTRMHLWSSQSLVWVVLVGGGSLTPRHLSVGNFPKENEDVDAGLSSFGKWTSTAGCTIYDGFSKQLDWGVIVQARIASPSYWAKKTTSKYEERRRNCSHCATIARVVGSTASMYNVSTSSREWTFLQWYMTWLTFGASSRRFKRFLGNSSDAGDCWIDSRCMGVFSEKVLYGLQPTEQTAFFRGWNFSSCLELALWISFDEWGKIYEGLSFGYSLDVGFPSSLC